MIFLKKISGREMLDQAEIALHCVIKFLKTYFASFKSFLMNFIRRNIRFRVLFLIRINFGEICAPTNVTGSHAGRILVLLFSSR